MLAKACTVDSDGGALVVISSPFSLLRSLQDVSEVGWHRRGHGGVVVSLDAVRRDIRNHALDISLESRVRQEVRRGRSEWIACIRDALSRVGGPHRANQL